MRTVWKYDIKPDDYHRIEMPAGATLLDFKEQRGVCCLWALVDPEAPAEPRRFRMAGTGHYIADEPTTMAYVGTAMMHNGALVFHLFEVPA